MTTARLLLVRHGQADGSDSEDPPLSELGQRQARALGERLADAGIARVLTGPRRRAGETARIISGVLGVEPEETDLLADRTPVPSARRRSDYPERYWTWLASTPHAEQDVDGQLIDGAAFELARMTRATQTGRVVAITHAFVVGWIVRALLDAPTQTWIRLAPANAGLTMIDCAGNQAELVSYNDTGHLAAIE